MSIFKQSIVVILSAAFLFALQLFAFQEPTSSPPSGNVPAPLNTGSSGQSKSGGLILNTGGASYGLIIQNGFVGIGTAAPGDKLDVNGGLRALNANITGSANFATSGGNVGIGTQSPTQKLDVAGNIQFSGALMPNGDAGLSGQVLTSQGPGNPPKWVGSPPPPPPPPHGEQTFTSSGTFTVPARVTQVTVEVVGGGGGGGSGGSGTAANAGGGGGGGFAQKLINVSGITSIPVTIGNGGPRGTGNWPGKHGGSGGTSSFGSYVSASGGGGGMGYVGGGYSDPMSGGAGGTGINGDTNIAGTDGSPGVYNARGGNGGSSGRGYGSGGAGGYSSISGSPGGLYGGGGGGGGDGGGNGASGFIRVVW